MIHSLHLDSFYLTDEQLENSPSRQDGIDRDTENTLRMYGCMLIQEAGILLSFSQVVMATGQVLLHRFYCKRSMKTFNVKVGAHNSRGTQQQQEQKASSAPTAATAEQRCFCSLCVCCQCGVFVYKTHTSLGIPFDHLLHILHCMYSCVFAESCRHCPVDGCQA